MFQEDQKIIAGIQSDADFAKGEVILSYFRSKHFSQIGIVQPGFTLGEVGQVLVSDDLDELKRILGLGKMKYAVPNISRVAEGWKDWAVPLEVIEPDDDFMVVGIPPLYLVQRKADYDKVMKG